MLSRKFAIAPMAAIFGLAFLMLSVAPSWAHTPEELQDWLRIQREMRDNGK